jgi:hypothetical protein
MIGWWCCNLSWLYNNTAKLYSMGWLMNWKGYKRKQPRPNQDTIPIRASKKTTKNLSWHSQCAGQDLNSVLLNRSQEHYWPAHSVWCCCYWWWYHLHRNSVIHNNVCVSIYYVSEGHITQPSAITDCQVVTKRNASLLFSLK